MKNIRLWIYAGFLLVLSIGAAGAADETETSFKTPVKLKSVKELNAAVKSLGRKSAQAAKKLQGAPAVKKLSSRRVIEADDVTFRTDWLACVDGWMSMDIQVDLDGEVFDFNPGCGHSFDEEFTTKKGRECEVKAGMCTTWSPERRFEIECSDGLEVGFDVPCAGESRGDILIKPDWDECAEGWMSMDIRVRVGRDYFDFKPNCSFPFNQRFAAPDGGECRVDATMCSGHFPEKSFRVSCAKGQQAEISIPCDDNF
ncbi:MAG: hypothetical protein ABIJ96_04035 [Elusimicrobiota bacterium]